MIAPDGIVSGKPKIYLIGSYKMNRDELIAALPGFDIVDPRMNRQSAMAKAVIDDLGSAKYCPFSFTNFPVGKRGIASYSDMGASKKSGNILVVADEDVANQDFLLPQIAAAFFTNKDHAMEYLRNYRGPIPKHPVITKHYSVDKWDQKIPCNKILVCGTIDEEILKIVDKAQKESPTAKTFHIAAPKEGALLFKSLDEYDMIVAHFRPDLQSGKDYWDRPACLLMGGAFVSDIPIIIIDKHEMKYPPLQGMARRYFDLGDKLRKYLTFIDDQNIVPEANLWYKISEGLI